MMNKKLSGLPKTTEDPSNRGTSSAKLINYTVRVSFVPISILGIGLAISKIVSANDLRMNAIGPAIKCVNVAERMKAGE
jgi:hypothetical protein